MKTCHRYIGSIAALAIFVGVAHAQQVLSCFPSGNVAPAAALNGGQSFELKDAGCNGLSFAFSQSGAHAAQDKDLDSGCVLYTPFWWDVGLGWEHGGAGFAGGVGGRHGGSHLPDGDSSWFAGSWRSGSDCGWSWAWKAWWEEQPEAAVPEPAAYAVVLNLTVLGLVSWRRRSRRQVG